MTNLPGRPRLIGQPSQDDPAPGDFAAPRTIDEQSGHCFGCGPANPHGLHLHFSIIEPPAAESITATAHFTLTEMHEGAPGFIHGGLIATVLDEAMSKLNRPLHVLAMTRHLDIDYLRPAPSNQPLVVVGRHLRRDGRKLFQHAELQSTDGTVLARGKGLFIVIQEQTLQVI